MQTELEFPDLVVVPAGSGHGNHGRDSAAGTVGRTEALRCLQGYADRRLDALLLGPPGVGKSHLLAQVRGPRIVRIHRLGPTRQAVLDIAEALFHAGVLRPAESGPTAIGRARHGQPGMRGPGQTAEADTRPRLAPAATSTPQPRPGPRKPVAPTDRLGFATYLRQHPRTTLHGWTRIVVRAVPPRQWLLVIDDLSGLNRSQGQLLDQLAERFVVLAALCELPRADRQRFARYQRIALDRLPRPQAVELMRQRLAGARIDNPALVEAYLWHHSAGNPRALVEMIQQLRRQPRITEDAARDLEYPGARPTLDLTPIILIPAVFLVAARFVARGLGDAEAYILAGVGAALVMGAQFALFRMRR